MSKPVLHTACLSLGSNIEPASNLVRAVQLLRTAGTVERLSSVWETPSVGTDGPHFLNAALIYHTSHAVEALKNQVLRPIEDQLGRVRSADKNAPRPIDLDIILFDQHILDPELWSQLYLAGPIAQLWPDLPNPAGGRSLKETARELGLSTAAILHPEINLQQNEVG
jgi:2-amino-4-hydroxy-6-hydroxymethyldihydropteridine diphosphokinase